MFVRISISLALLASSVLACFAQTTSAASAPAQPAPCTEPQQKQFDFWLGDWNLTWPSQNSGETVHGANSIKRVLDGCVIEENFDGGTVLGLRGLSVSRFEPRSGKWKQTWVDNQGGYLDFTGEFKDGQMVLQREGARPDGSKVLQRMVYKNITEAEFDWSWERSLDGGKTWQVLWPIHYKRKS